MTDPDTSAEAVRYFPSKFGDGMIPSPRGGWVRFEDYATLAEAADAAQLEKARLLGMSGERESALRAEVERLGREVNRAKYGEPDFAWSLHKAALHEAMARAEAAEAEVERLRSAASSAADDIQRYFDDEAPCIGTLADVRDMLRASLTATQEPPHG